MKKFLSILCIIALVLSLVGVASAEGTTKKIGVSMPTQSLQRWNQDGANMKSQLEAAGYEVDVQYANDQVALQVSQIENMILGGVDILVISAIDGSTLSTVLADAKAAGIVVVAYDRLIMQTDAVSYYASFDNYIVGQTQGEYLKTALDLDNRTDSVNIEIVAGDPADNNATLFYQGAYDVLAPYIESGKVVVPSGQIEFAVVGTPTWSSATAQARMDNLIAANYADGTKLDAVLCSNDSTALGTVNALIGAGFEKENFPLITGQDCDVANVKNIIAGYQSMSIFKDTRILAEQVLKMVNDILEGKVPETNNDTYDNGVIIVPTYILPVQFADADNYAALLVDTGYYTADQLVD
jgi:putative multiple sugar transport system substrate-binding protein